MRLLLEMQKAFEVDVEEVLPQQGFFHLLSSMFISQLEYKLLSESYSNKWLNIYLQYPLLLILQINDIMLQSKQNRTFDLHQRPSSLKNLHHHHKQPSCQPYTDVLGQRIKKLGAQNHQLRLAATQARKEIEKSHLTITSLTAQLLSLKSQTNKDSETHLEQLSMFQTTITNLTKDKGKYVDEIGKREAVIAELQRSKAESQSKVGRLVEQVKEYQYVEKVVETLREDNGRLGKEVERLRNQLVRDQGEGGKHARRQSGSMSQSNINASTPTKKHSPPATTTVPSSPTPCQPNLQPELNRLQLSLNSLSHSLFIAQGKVDWLQQDKKDIQFRHQQQLTSITDKVQFFKQQLGEVMQQLEEKTRQAEGLKENYEECMERLTSEMLIIEEKEKKIGELGERVGVMEKVAEQYEKLKVTYGKAEQEINQKEVAMKELVRGHQQEVERENGKRVEREIAFAEEIKAVEERLRKSQQDLMALKQAHGKLTQQWYVISSDLQTSHQTIKTLTQKCQNYQKSLSTLQQQQKSLQTNQITRLKNELLHHKKQILQLSEGLKSNLQTHMKERDELAKHFNQKSEKLMGEVRRLTKEVEEQRGRKVLEVKELKMAFEREREREVYRAERERQRQREVVREKEREVMRVEREREKQRERVGIERERRMEREASQRKAYSDRIDNNNQAIIVSKFQAKLQQQRNAIYQYTEKLVQKQTQLSECKQRLRQAQKDITVLLEKFSQQLNPHIEVLMQKDAIIDNISYAANLQKQTQYHTRLNYQQKISQLKQDLRQQISDNNTLRRTIQQLQKRSKPSSNDLLIIQHSTRIHQDDRKRRLSILQRLKSPSIDNFPSQLSLLQSLVTQHNSLLTQLSTLEQFKHLNCQLQQTLQLTTTDLRILKQTHTNLLLSQQDLKATVEALQKALLVSKSDITLLNERIIQLQEENKEDRLLMIRMEEEHGRLTQERGVKFQQQYDALLLKYEKYRRIAQKEKERKEAQRVIIRESNQFNQQVINRCRAIIND